MSLIKKTLALITVVFSLNAVAQQYSTETDDYYDEYSGNNVYPNQTQQAISSLLNEVIADEQNWRNFFLQEQYFDPEKMAIICLTQLGGNNCDIFVLKAMVAFHYTKTGQVNPTQAEWDAVRSASARVAADCQVNCLKDQLLQQSSSNVMDSLRQMKNFGFHEQWNNISQRTSGSEFCKFYTFQQMAGYWLNAVDINDPTDNRNNKQWVNIWAANLDAFMKQKNLELTNDPRWVQIQDYLNSVPRESRGEAMRQVLYNECQQ